VCELSQKPLLRNLDFVLHDRKEELRFVRLGKEQCLGPVILRMSRERANDISASYVKTFLSRKMKIASKCVRMMIRDHDVVQIFAQREATMTGNLEKDDRAIRYMVRHNLFKGTPRSRTATAMGETLDRHFLLSGIRPYESRRRTRSVDDAPTPASTLSSVLDKFWPTGTSLEISISIADPTLKPSKTTWEQFTTTTTPATM